MPSIPTWKDRLKACFQFRHRLMHVFGVPAALGAATAVAASTALNANTGFALGALVAAMGTTLAGYFVTSGFDRKLVARLTQERAARDAVSDAQQVQAAVWNAPPDVRPLVERIVTTHGSIEAVFADGLDDPVERILEGSRRDLLALRDRAITMVELHRRLGEIIVQSDGRRLWEEANRLEAQLARVPEGAARQAQAEALASAKRTFQQWQAAVDKQNQVRAVLTVIEKNLEEFKLAMALRKADALDGDGSAPNVSELQSRLVAAGEACDQLVGRAGGDERRARRERA